LILRSNGVTEFVETPGWPLGTQKDALYSVVKVHLAAGDTILMATDGITEARSGNAFLGLDGFASLAEKVGPIASLSELADAISTGARDFADGVQKDDVCMLLARRR
jgi:sigma-B regulation protein RsbU (phosphoserine phosphatase)